MEDCEELSLELSIGGKYAGKSENLGEKTGDFCVQNANSSGDLGVRRCDFSESIDLQRRREIQVSRRLESRRKREEKVKRSRRVGFVEDKLFLEAQKFQGRVGDREIRENHCYLEEKSRKIGNGEVADELGLSLFSEYWAEILGAMFRFSLHVSESGDAGNQSSPSRPRHESPCQAAETARELAPMSNPQPTTWMRSPESSTSPASENGGEAPKGGPQMPCVLATGEGPNGRTVIGFLYKYDRREVSIMCVCHGSSFSPAEFVEHAAGGDVSHPLRHITIVT